MKKIYLIIFIFIVFQGIKAQENENYQTIFGRGTNRISAFGGPFYNYSVVNNEFVLFSGGGGALLINDFYIGGFGVKSKNTIPYNSNQEITMQYGGIWLGNSFFGNRPLHLTFSFQTGWGKIKPQTNYYIINPIDRIFVLNPELGLELNIARFFRLSVGANYRFVGGLSNSTYLSTANASGVGINFMLKFGWF
jgi:hypothetical protein